MVFKEYGRKIRYAKLLKRNKRIPYWVSLKKYGRLRYIPQVIRNWRIRKISL